MFRPYYSSCAETYRVTIALEDEGFELVSCSSGDEALLRAVDLTPDLILLDVMTPCIDEPTTLRKLRKLPHLTSAAVIYSLLKLKTIKLWEH